eukprot:GHVH01008222.1.p1 GENE.GHVH01008222.1~~GHVH01008222.1.p1  ORF type:complete len:548 (+),score=22.29 GHVH01008222.1:100-1743(+)
MQEPGNVVGKSSDDGHRRTRSSSRASRTPSIPLMTAYGDTVRPSHVPALDFTKVHERKKQNSKKDPWLPPPLPSISRSKSDLTPSYFSIPTEIQVQLHEANSFSGVLPNVDNEAVVETNMSSIVRATPKYGTAIASNTTKAFGSFANSIGVSISPTGLGSKKGSRRKSSTASASRKNSKIALSFSGDNFVPPLPPTSLDTSTFNNGQQAIHPNEQSLPYIKSNVSSGKGFMAPLPGGPTASAVKTRSMTNVRSFVPARPEVQQRRHRSVAGINDAVESRERHRSQTSPNSVSTVLGPSLWYFEQLCSLPVVHVYDAAQRCRSDIPPIFLPICNGCLKCLLPIQGLGHGCQCTPISLMMSKLKWAGYAAASNTPSASDPLISSHHQRSSSAARRSNSISNINKIKGPISLPIGLVPPVLGLVVIINDYDNILTRTDIDRVTKSLRKMFDYIQKFSCCMEQAGFSVTPGTSGPRVARRASSSWYRLPSSNSNRGTKTSEKVLKSSMGSVMKRRDSWSEVCRPAISVIERVVNNGANGTSLCLCDLIEDE